MRHSATGTRVVIVFCGCPVKAGVPKVGPPFRNHCMRENVLRNYFLRNCVKLWQSIARNHFGGAIFGPAGLRGFVVALCAIDDVAEQLQVGAKKSRV